MVLKVAPDSIIGRRRCRLIRLSVPEGSPDRLSVPQGCAQLDHRTLEVSPDSISGTSKVAPGLDHWDVEGIAPTRSSARRRCRLIRLSVPQRLRPDSIIGTSRYRPTRSSARRRCRRIRLSYLKGCAGHRSLGRRRYRPTRSSGPRRSRLIRLSGIQFNVSRLHVGEPDSWG